MRILDLALLNLQTAKNRRRAYKLDVYDIVSTRGTATVDSISKIVQILVGSPSSPVLNVLSGPTDFTDFVESIAITERGSDFAQGTLGGNSIEITIADRRDKWDPVEGSEPRWLRNGNVVVLREGDSAVSNTLWPITFTGTIVGRAGSSGQDRDGNARLTLFAEDRMLSFLKTTVTTRDILQGTAYSDIIRQILEDELLITSDEYFLGSAGTAVTSQASTQMVDENPMSLIAKLGFRDGFVPRFRGNGVMEMVPNFTDVSPAVIYDDSDLLIKFERPFSPLETPNRVEVIGLDKTQSKIGQPRQSLANAGLTLGFFGGDSSIKVRFSDDETQQASNTKLKTNSSVTGSLIPFGSETWVPTLDSDGGCRGGRIKVVGAFYAPLIVVGFAGRIAASFIPDGNVGFIGGSTIPIGRLIEGVVTIVNQTIMSTIGSGDYEILGEPFEWVFKELKGVAQIAEVATKDLRTIEIENHLLDTQTIVETVALRELKTARKRGNDFTVTMRHDMRLEPMDKFLRPDAREFIVNEITRTIGRGTSEVATLACYESTGSAIP